MELIGEKVPDLIISDIIMPEMDGFELCKTIKKDEDMKDVPVILVTHLSDSEDIIRGLESNADNFMVKPYDEKCLLSRIQNLLINFDLRSQQNVFSSEIAIKFYFSGKYYTINSDRRQILDLLISTFESAVQQNKELQQNQNELRALYEELRASKSDLENLNEELQLKNKLLEENKDDQTYLNNLLKQEVSEKSRINDDMQQFALTASYDLQEPLRMIKSYAKLLEKRYKRRFDPDADDFLDFIIDGSNRMSLLINDILEYSKVSDTTLKLEKTDCNIILEKVLNIMKIQIQEKNVMVTSDKLTVITAVPSQIYQIFQNLLSNPIKYNTSESPNIHISFAEKEIEWLFCIKDNGIGIEKENIDKIFKIFQRLHSTQEYSGTGIGLALCKRIVENHGGQFKVYSEVGKGSAFCFTFPITQQDKNGSYSNSLDSGRTT